MPPRALALWDDGYAPGYDGYYYVLQGGSAWAGAPLFEDRSLLFPLLGALAAALGDAVLAHKGLACALGALTAAAMAVAGRRWTGSAGAGAAAGAWAALSPGHLAVSAEYLKNAAGLAAVAALLAVLPGCERRGRALAGAAALVLLAASLHKLTGALAIGVALAHALGVALDGRVPRAWAALVAAIAAVSALGVGLLRPVDLERLVFVADPAARWHGLWRAGLDLGALAELALAPLAVVGWAVVLWRRAAPPGLGLAALLLAVVAVAPGLPFGLDQTAWRLMLTGFLATGLLAAVAAARWGPLVPAAVLVGGILATPGAVRAVAAREPDYAAWVDAAAAIRGAVPPADGLVAMRGVCAFLMVETGRRCETFQPEGDLTRVWRVAYGFGEARLAPYCAPEAPPRSLTRAATLVREDGWRRFATENAGRFALLDSPLNPSAPRPGYVHAARPAEALPEALPGAAPEASP